jgi:hypothetical protein
MPYFYLQHDDYVALKARVAAAVLSDDASAAPPVRKTHILCATLYPEMIILPSQARDKHGECTRKREIYAFLAGGRRYAQHRNRCAGGKKHSHISLSMHTNATP